MKKLLTSLVALNVFTISTSSVIACSVFNPNDSTNTNKPGQESVDSFKELRQTDETWDYVYTNKISYQKASEYYLKTAQDFYQNFIKSWVDEGKSENDIWYLYGDLYFQSIIWYANEAQWDLIRIDEFDGSYKYDEININQLVQNSYSKKWYQERLVVLKKYISYYSGINDEIKNAGKWGIYAMGMNNALARYKTAKQAQIDEPIEGLNPTELTKDMEFINNLTTFWKNRFDIVQKLSEKINDILINWNEN